MGIHEMTAPLAESFFNQRVVAAEEDELHGAIRAKQIAIFSFERRAGQHSVVARCNALLDFLLQSLQPRPAIPVRERIAGAGHAEENDNHCEPSCCRLPIFSSRKAANTNSV